MEDRFRLAALAFLLMITGLGCVPAKTVGAASIAPRSAATGDAVTELAWIIAALTPLSRNKPSSIDTSSPYYAEVQQWFGPHRSHAVVQALGGDFSLPRWIGNASRYVLDDSGQLRRLSPTPLWNDSAGDTFTFLLEATEDFARESEFIEFYSQHHGFYRETCTETLRAANGPEMETWLEQQLGQSPAPVTILVSSLTGGHHWASIDDGLNRIWVAPPRAGAADDLVSRVLYRRGIFTEIAHRYVNPRTAASKPRVDLAISARLPWATPVAAENYSSAELVWNEYITWAAFLIFAQDRLDRVSFDRVSETVIQRMTERRGFPAFDRFVAHALSLVGAAKRRLIEILPELLAWSEDFSQRAPE